MNERSCKEILQQIDLLLAECRHVLGYAIVRPELINRYIDEFYTNITLEIDEAKRKNKDLSNCHIFDSMKRLESYLENMFVMFGYGFLDHKKLYIEYLLNVIKDLRIINGN